MPPGCAIRRLSKPPTLSPSDPSRIAIETSDPRVLAWPCRGAGRVVLGSPCGPRPGSIEGWLMGESPRVAQPLSVERPEKGGHEDQDSLVDRPGGWEGGRSRRASGGGAGYPRRGRGAGRRGLRRLRFARGKDYAATLPSPPTARGPRPSARVPRRWTSSASAWVSGFQVGRRRQLVVWQTSRGGDVSVYEERARGVLAA